MADSLYTLVHQHDDKDQPSLQDLKNALEKGKDEDKVETMKKILIIMLNGDPLHGILMHVIRFVMPSKSKVLKKLLLVYWEICPKTNPDGKMKQEMILVCNALRNDLQHPNEYIRGMTLRFICKLKEIELVEPSVPTVRQCLEHRHAFVRKNAVLAIYSIYKNAEYLIPDAPELIRNYISSEADHNGKRNALIMLMNTNQEMAVEWMISVWDQIPTFDPVLQLSIIELIRKDCKSVNADRGKYIQGIFSLLETSSHAVKYEAANTLVTLTTHATAVKAAASCYVELVVKEADNNVKLIVLDRLEDLRKRNERMLDELVMDILHILNSPDISVRKKCLGIAMEMTSTRNVEEVIGFLKKELTKTQEQEYERNNEYKQNLVQAIHQCAIKFSEVAASVVHVLMEFLGEQNTASAVDVIAFVREVMEKFPHLRTEILVKLLESFSHIKSGRVFRGVLWILGEYAQETKLIDKGIAQILNVLGELPILASEEREAKEKDEQQNGEGSAESGEKAKSPTSTKLRVLADGTYATESALSSQRAGFGLSLPGEQSKPPLRALLLNGDFFVGSVLASALAKMVLRYAQTSQDQGRINVLKAQAMLIMASIIRVGKSKYVAHQIDEDTHDRILTCLRALSTVSNEKSLQNMFLIETRKAFAQLIKAEQEKKEAGNSKEKEKVKIQADDQISFRLLKSKKNGDWVDTYDVDVTKATGTFEKKDKLVSKLNRVVQLTGFSDPVYAEAYVTVHQYDILLDVLIVNQTSETLQNLTLEFSTLGDLKLVERPMPHTVGPRGFHTIKANIKVSSTDTGVIFGNIVYDGSSSVDMHCVILNDIHIDIMDYITPGKCTETQFRSMWTEFEWENKVNVNTNISDLHEYLQHILKSTNMNCLTPEHALSGNCGFLAANLYAKSIFGEDALANICLEQGPQGNITGHIRIRAKTQGIALSLGDKITLCQKKQKPVSI